MGTYTLSATATFGLESVVASELDALGYRSLTVQNGQVLFQGDGEDVARCNLWLRAADRVLIKLAEFEAGGSDDVYEGVRSVRWKDFLPPTARVVVNAKSVNAPLGVPALQSVGKKAVVDALAVGRLEETGPLYPVLISVSAGRAVVTLDTSGAGLHKRGYRTEAGEAPLKETLAAGMVLLSRWDPSRPFADPLCGSGTIPIEAALIAANAAPGLARSFAAEEWPHIPKEAWQKARDEARGARGHAGGAGGPARDARAEQRAAPRLRIIASDRDSRVLELARRNAARAGVADAVAFSCVELSRARLEGEYGCIVTNPPYAERQGDEREIKATYRDLGRLFGGLPTWSLFALSAHPAFQKLFGQQAAKNRKLYNGNIRCYFHQYFGPLPARGD